MNKLLPFNPYEKDEEIDRASEAEVYGELVSLNQLRAKLFVEKHAWEERSRLAAGKVDDLKQALGSCDLLLERCQRRLNELAEETLER